jgi:hypothetical protein
MLSRLKLTDIILSSQHRQRLISLPVSNWALISDVEIESFQSSGWEETAESISLVPYISGFGFISFSQAVGCEADYNRKGDNIQERAHPRNPMG